MDSAEKSDVLRLLNIRWRFQNEVPKTMTDRITAPKNQRQLDSRKNLFFLLQTLARQAQVRASAYKASLEFSTTDEQVEEYVRRSRIAL